MTETKKPFKHTLVRVSNESMELSDKNDNKVVLPRVGHTPLYKDKIFSSVAEDGSVTYSFVDRQSNEETASYVKATDGSVKVKYGEKEVSVSSETMKEIENGASAAMRGGSLNIISTGKIPCGHRVKSIERPNRKKLYTASPRSSDGR